MAVGFESELKAVFVSMLLVVMSYVLTRFNYNSIEFGEVS